MKYDNLLIHWLGHAGFKIKDDHNQVIYIDPFQINTDEKADIIFITHAHYDHCSIGDMKKIIKPQTIIVCGTDVQSKLGKIGNAINSKIVEPNKEYEVAGIKCKTIPAYNKNKAFHPQENHWLGYLLTIGETTIYHAGDTDLIPEMNHLKTDLALLPVGGTYTMNAKEAAEAVQQIQSQVAIPMHWGSIIGSREDAETFVSLCKKNNRTAEIIEKEN